MKKIIIALSLLLSMPVLGQIDEPAIEASIAEFQQDMQKIVSQDFQLFNPQIKPGIYCDMKCDYSYYHLLHLLPKQDIIAKLLCGKRGAVIIRPSNKNAYYDAENYHIPQFIETIFNLLRLGDAQAWENESEGQEMLTTWKAVAPLSESTKLMLRELIKPQNTNQMIENRYNESTASDFGQLYDSQIVEPVLKLSKVAYEFFAENELAAISAYCELGARQTRIVFALCKIMCATFRDFHTETKNKWLAENDIVHNRFLEVMCHLRQTLRAAGDEDFNSFGYFDKSFDEKGFQKKIGEFSAKLRQSYLRELPQHFKSVKGQGDLDRQFGILGHKLWLNYAFLNLLRLNDRNFDQIMRHTPDLHNTITLCLSEANLRYLENTTAFELADYTYSDAENEISSFVEKLRKGTAGYKFSELRNSRDPQTRRAVFYILLCDQLMRSIQPRMLIREYRDIFEQDLHGYLGVSKSAAQSASSATASTSTTSTHGDALVPVPAPAVEPTPPTYDELVSCEKDNRTEAAEIYQFLSAANLSHRKLAERLGGIRFKIPNLSFDELAEIATYVRHAQQLQAALDNTVKNIEELASKKAQSELH